MSNKKQLIYLFLLGGILTALIMVLQKAKEGDDGTTMDSKFSDFAIDDTTAITKIIISDANGDKAVLVKIGENNWLLNGKYKARTDAMHIIFKTAKLISVRSEVPKSAEKSVISTMAVGYKKVEYYSGGVLLKTWYVGHKTKDGYGTYMLLSKPEKGKSTVPYITEIKGFFGNLSTRFFTDEKEWRYKVIYELQPGEISSVDFVNNENPEYSFKIEVKGKNKFELFDHTKSKVPDFDTVSVRSYLLSYRKVAFETFNRGILNEKQEDSLRKAIPFALITVKDVKENSTTLKLYRKAPTPEQKNVADQNYQWDVERLFAILPTGEVIIMQYGTVDKIWRAILNFKRA